MRALVRKSVVAAACGALLVGVPAVGGAAERAALSCDDDSSGQEASFYDGLSAGYTYDEKFSAGPGIPGLPEHTPQGLAGWNDWDGSGNDLLLVTAYGKDGNNAKIYGVDPKSGKTVGDVEIAETHASGIGISRGWAFVTGRNTADGNYSIRKYELSKLADALKAEGSPYLKQTGTAREVYGASFLAGDGNTLYAGKYSRDGREKMYAYSVAANGDLTTGKSYEIPKGTQGLMVTGDKFVYSTSLSRDVRSNLYVIDKGATDIDIPSTRCFRSPSMSEGIDDVGGTAYVLYESGSYQYPDARNVIQDMHKAPLSGL
ncbi:hypothetical protein EIL87_22340 [Saccharopolyspora rhizosphaerae]|uniref:Uncharacterized protein n=1 Tax=Saccharopolyspora rhizosphaerae TaxID=2492662 RepID=A0A3R8QYC2_9PSEU|nr:hypothetical protein [Saccharopolyspora rhizosphaerae]RRO13728.1 hypothetical protein EIL87_22340 [Saccharopolyspora rhizosphaerae]